MDSPQAKTMLLLEADGERDSNLKKIQQFSSVKYFWSLKHRFVEFNEVEKHYKKLEEECRHYEESIKKIKEPECFRYKGDNITDRQAWHNQHKYHQELHQETIGLILAWKNDKLILGLKALKGSNKQSNPKNYDAIRDAIRASEDPICCFESLVGCYCWRRYNKTFMTPKLRTEFEGIIKDRKIWMGLGRSNSRNRIQEPPDEEQMKKLLQDTIRVSNFMSKWNKVKKR
ncbi:hypothetical protein ACFE04_016627 [Oxalis oulophora]